MHGKMGLFFPESGMVSCHNMGENARLRHCMVSHGKIEVKHADA